MADLKFIGTNYPSETIQRQANPTADSLLINRVRPTGGGLPFVIEPVNDSTIASATLFRVLDAPAGTSAVELTRNSTGSSFELDIAGEIFSSRGTFNSPWESNFVDFDYQLALTFAPSGTPSYGPASSASVVYGTGSAAPDVTGFASGLGSLLLTSDGVAYIKSGPTNTDWSQLSTVDGIWPQLAPSGSAAAPSYAFAPNSGTGVSSSVSGDSLIISADGDSVLEVLGAPVDGSGVTSFLSVAGDASQLNSTSDGFTLIQGNVVDTALGASGPKLLLSLGVDSTPVWEVDSTGTLVTGTIGGAAGGDLSGTYPNPTVGKLQGRDVASTVPTNAYVLTWNSGAARWEPQAAPGSTVTLQDAYDGDPTVTLVSATPIALTAAGANEDGVTVTDGTATARYRADAVVVEGDTLTITAGGGQAAVVDGLLSAATGDEVAFDLSYTVNKLTSGNYTGLKVNVTETSVPGSANKLMDLQLGGTSFMQLMSTGQLQVAAAGAGLPIIASFTDDDTGITWAGSGDDILRVAAGGEEVMRVGPHDAANGSGEIDFCKLEFDPTLQNTVGDGWNALAVDVLAPGNGSGADQRMMDLRLAGTTVAAIDVQGALHVSDGYVTDPSLSFLSEPSTGFRWSGAGEMRGVCAGTDILVLTDAATASDPILELQDVGTTRITVQRDGTIEANGTLTAQGSVTTGSPAVDLTNANSFTGSSGLQVFAQVAGTVNQTGTAGYAGLVVNITETATGSGGRTGLLVQQGADIVFRVADDVVAVPLDGTKVAPALQVGNQAMGLYDGGTNILGIAVNSEAVLLDNTGTDPEFTPDVDNTWMCGTSSLRWKEINTVVSNVGDIELHGQTDDAHWTINEDRHGLYAHDRKTGRVFKIPLVEIDPSEAPDPVN